MTVSGKPLVSADLTDSPAVAAARRPYRPGPIWLAVPGLAFLVVFFLWPTAHIFVAAVWSNDGGFSLAALSSVFTSPSYSRVMATTFVIAIEVTVLCVLISYPLAYWLSRHSPRRQRTLMMLILLPFWTSALVKNFAWLVLLGRTSILAQIVTFLGGTGDRLLFNRPVVLFGMVHTLVPLCVIAMMPTFNQVKRPLLAAATSLGATPAQAFWRIFLPLSMRGVATAGLIIFITALGFFITPSLLGSPRETTAGQLIIEQINEVQDLHQGNAFGTVLFAGAVLAVILINQIFGLAGLGAETGDRRARGLNRRFGIWLTQCAGRLLRHLDSQYRVTRKWVPGRSILTAYSLCLIAILLVPVIAIIPMAFTSGSFLAFPPPGLGMRWFSAYFASPIWMAATARSFGIGIASAIFTTIIALMVAFAIVRSKSRFSGAIFLLVMTPMIVPHLVIAIGLFSLFAQFSLIATDIGIVLGHSVIAMPVVFIVVLSTLQCHDWRLDDAALTLGARPGRIFLRVTLPLIGGGIVAGLITGLLISFEELTIALFVGGGLVTTLPKQLWSDIFLQIHPTLAAASVVVLCVVTGLFVLMEIITSRRKPGAR